MARASLMFFGFFGTSTPEGRRLARWTTATLGLALGLGGLAFVPSGHRAGVGGPRSDDGRAHSIRYARYLAARTNWRVDPAPVFAVAYRFAMLVAAGLCVYALTGRRKVNGVLAAALFGLAG